MSFQSLYVTLIEDIDYTPIITFIQSHLQKHQTILDAGCGSGVVMVPLVEAGYSVIGVDLDPNMLSYAHQALVEKSLPIQLFEHDLRTPLGQSFDVILLFNDVINYFKGAKLVLKNLKKALNPSGFILMDLYKESYLEVMDGYIEDELEPVNYTWSTEVSKHVLNHTIEDDYGIYHVTQYVYPLKYYQDILNDLGLTVEVLEGPDERKYYLKASL